MLRSKSVHTIRELAAQGKSIPDHRGRDWNCPQYGAQVPARLPSSRAAAAPESKLNSFKDQIRSWITEDHLLNCETMLERLRAQGYTGSISILKDFVQPLRPPRRGRQPVRRYETKPGEQMQVDWGEFLYEQDGQLHKLYGFTAVLSYSRMRFVCFTKRCDTASLIRCLMQACEYFEGLPTTILTDRMKSVLVQMDGNTPQWNTQFADFLAAIGVTARVCRAYTPQTKGKIERTIGVVKYSFWPGARFIDLDDLNRQAHQWCERRSQRVHATTRSRPLDRWADERLRPLPVDFAWERFRLEERRVTTDGFVSFDGVLYGVPAPAALCGQVVQVGVHTGTLSIWHQGQLVTKHQVRPISGSQVLHPEQFAGVPPAHTRHQTPAPLAHQMPPPTPVRRSLDEYDQLCGVAATEVAT